MRKDQAFVDKYKKDASFENVLQSLNKNLQISEKTLYQDFPENYSSIHIVGSPRSGTTLLNQLISSCLDVGYINNFIATFYQAPVHGITLSKKLLGINYPSSFYSDFGKTQSIYEPHEFGYFWSDLLKYPEVAQMPPEHNQAINWAQIRLTLLNMCQAFGSSVAFKSLYLGWHMESVVQHLPKTLFIYIERDVIENALSLLRIRQKYFGTIDEWASIKPLGYESLLKKSPHEQVLEQVQQLNSSYSQQLALLQEKNKLSINYQDLCENPEQLLSNIIAKLDLLGVKQSIYQSPPGAFSEQVTNVNDPDYQLLQGLRNKGICDT